MVKVDFVSELYRHNRARANGVRRAPSTHKISAIGRSLVREHWTPGDTGLEPIIAAHQRENKSDRLLKRTRYGQHERVCRVSSRDPPGSIGPADADPGKLDLP